MRLFIIFAVVLSSASLAGEKPKPPQVTIEQQAAWLQARAELAEARLALKTAEDRFNQIVREIQTVCPAILNQSGRPECPPKSEVLSKP